MHKAAGLICEEERVAWVNHCWETGLDVAQDYKGLFAQSIWKWLGRLVASQKRLLNFGDKENRHNQSLLGIQGRHSKLALTGQSVDQQEEDELTVSKKTD